MLLLAIGTRIILIQQHLVFNISNIDFPLQFCLMRQQYILIQLQSIGIGIFSIVPLYMALGAFRCLSVISNLCTQPLSCILLHRLHKCTAHPLPRLLLQFFPIFESLTNYPYFYSLCKYKFIISFFNGFAMLLVDVVKSSLVQAFHLANAC